MSRPCRACVEALGYRTAATDLRHIDDQLSLCRHCYNEIHRAIILNWTGCPYQPSGPGTVPRQREGRRKTVC
jgi:hypothetical protein